MGPLAHSLSLLMAIGLAPAAALALLIRPSLRHGLAERLGASTPVEDPRDVAWLARGAIDSPTKADVISVAADLPDQVLVPGSAETIDDVHPERAGHPIWIHAASVGEAKAATRLVDALLANRHAVCASTATLSGRAVFRRERPGLSSRLVPLDHPWIVERAIRGVAPGLSVLIETELWPSWIAACARHAVPVVVASGRLSDRSFPRYQRVRRLLASTLSRIDAVGARTDLDAERFAALGVPEGRIRVTGDLKLDPPLTQPALAIDLIRALADTPVVVGGNTHRGEESALLDALRAVEKAGNGFVLVLAPRDVGRTNEVVRLCEERGRRVLRRSRLEGRHLVPGEVLVLDDIGELAAVYATASLAFVGGTLVPVGGHNLIEPVHAGCPVLFGPHSGNVRKIVEILEVGEAGRRVTDAQALTKEIVEGFEDLEACRRRGAIGRETVEAHRGSVDQTRTLIEEVLERRDRSRP